MLTQGGSEAYLLACNFSSFSDLIFKRMLKHFHNISINLLSIIFKATKISLVLGHILKDTKIHPA